MIYLIEAMEGKYLVEQPASSLLWRHPRLEEHARRTCVHSSVFVCVMYCLHIPCISHALCRPSQVWRQSFWMRIYGAPTLKRTKIWSNSKKIRKLRTRKLVKQDRTSVKVKLAKVSVSQGGKKCFTGDKKLLKKSQILDRSHLDLNYFDWFLDDFYTIGVAFDFYKIL